MGTYNEEAIKMLQSTKVEKKPIKRKHPFRNFLIFVCVVSGTIFFLSTSMFDIKSIDVEGNRYYSDEEIITLADGRKGVNIFWGAGDGKMKNRLYKDPYFQDVSIKRTLPSKITIKVKERTQVAAIEYGDKYVVIDSDGIVLRTGKIDPKLTIISGLKIIKLKKGELLEVKQEKTFKRTLKMLLAMERGDLFFKKAMFQEDEDRNITAYVLDSLVVKGKPQVVLKRIKSGDLQKVVNNLMKNGDVRGTIVVDDNNFITFSPDI